MPITVCVDRTRDRSDAMLLSDWLLQFTMKLFTNRFDRQFGFPGRVCLVALLTINCLALQVVRADQFGSNTLAQISALMQEKENRTPAQLKMDSQLVYALKTSRNETIATGVVTLRTPVSVDANGRVEVDIKGEIAQALGDFITQSGGVVVNSYPRFNSLRASFPLAAIESLAERGDVRFIRYAYSPRTHVGSLNSEGDITQAASSARLNFGVNGAGVKVGVLSDSVDYMPGSQATGDLPANVTVLPGQAGTGSGEGTAMLEIVHDLAPGADLFFATAFNGEAGFAQNILDLRTAGCDVIVDDVGYITEPIFQDGIIAQAVDQAVASGAVYFAAAGNSGNKAHDTSGTWEGDFVDGGSVTVPSGRNGIFHSFGTTNYNRLTAWSSWLSALYWSDPQGMSTNDYDLYLLDAGGNVVAAGTDPQTGTQDPIEITIPGSLGQSLAVVKVTGDARVLCLASHGELEFNTTGSAFGHVSATNCIATAAIDVALAYPNAFQAQNRCEDFSSDGPRRVFYHYDGTPITPGDYLSTGGFLRQIPDLTASDGVSTTVPGFRPFFGTSAAAPHAAAIAALIKSYNPHLASAEIRSIMNASCLDNEAPGYDVTAGNGILMAALALQNTPTPVPRPRFLVTTNFVSGGNNNGIIDYNECNNFDIVLANVGNADATGIRATLSTTAPGAAIGNRTVSYPDIFQGATGTNLVSFRISTLPEFVCGQPINLELVIKSDQVVSTNYLILQTGIPGPTLQFDNYSQLTIPPGTAAGTNSTIAVSNVNFTVSKVVVSLHVTHSFDGSLALELVGPDGTTAILSAYNGGAGQNYGLGCFPENLRTTFDDEASTAIGAGGPPFVGRYKPQEALSVFGGKSGTNANGLWQLRATTGSRFAVGTIQCWSLYLTPASCIDGGGACPGSDLALGISSSPNPGMVGSPLTYTLSVTNLGPGAATNVAVSHVLPASVQLVSFTTEQGGASHSAGVITWNAGKLNPRQSTTMTVLVVPQVPGFISSSATASSEQGDFDLVNNTATVLTRISPLTADLAVRLQANPAATFVGIPVSYAMTVTNFGPGSASGVMVTNVLPAGVTLTSATVSQGLVAVNGNTVVCSFGNITNSGRATANLQVIPTVEGSLAATATVGANTFDPVMANNSVAATVVVGPAADLSLTVVDHPDPVVLNSRLSYNITIANRGPSVASGVVLNATLPTGANLVSNYTSQGSVAVSGSGVVVNLLSLESGATASVVLATIPNISGTLSFSATVSGSQSDPNLADNSFTASTLVAAPFIQVASAGATLVVESVSPANGAVEPGETVTAALRLRNVGNIPTTNVVATLVAANGITPIGEVTQAYQVLSPGGFPVTRFFQFSAAGTNGGAATAVLQIKDGDVVYPPVSFPFYFSSVRTFSSTNSITLRDNRTASPYPSTIAVSGLSGTVGNVTATLVNAGHTYPQDISALVVGPDAQNTALLMAGAGTAPMEAATVTFDDNAATALPPGQILTGAYRPASYLPSVTLPAPAPGGPYGSVLSVFNGKAPNGTWSLYMNDQAAGDSGAVTNGWQLTFTMITPVNQLADLSISAVPSPVQGVTGVNLTNTFRITNSGPNTAAFVAFTNHLPAGLTFVAGYASQGTVFGEGSMAVGNLGTLSTGAVATLSVVVTPELGTVGWVTNTATVFADETDLNGNNNTVAVANAINLPVADIAFEQKVEPNPVLVGGAFTFTSWITNQGPMTALRSKLSSVLPAGVEILSASSSAGSATNFGGVVTWDLGDLPSGASAEASLVLSASASGMVTNLTSLQTASLDPNLANNQASTVADVQNPSPAIVAVGARLLVESFSPPNGTVESGETVTVSLRLANQGTAGTANLVATLQPSQGVTPVGATQQTYGALLPGGPSVEKDFMFSANGDVGETLVATLKLQDGAASLGEVNFLFTLPGSGSFSSTASIVIPEQGIGAPYPAIIQVEDLAGTVSGVGVTLYGVSHRFPRDLNVLLVSPSGAKVLLMSHAGGAYAVTNATLSFADSGVALPSSEQITSGVYRPSQYGGQVVFPGPAPAPAYDSTLAAINSSDPNGSWLLYVLDDGGGDAGVVTGGWSLNLTTVSAVNALSDLALTMSSTPDVLFTEQQITSRISVVNEGPGVAQGVTVTNVIPAGVSFDMASLPESVIALSPAGPLVWNVGEIPVHGASSIDIVTTPVFAGTWISTAQVSSDTSMDLNPANDFAQTTVTVLMPLPGRVSGELLPDGQFQITVTGQSGIHYGVEASQDLSTWTLIGDGIAIDGSVTVIDSNAPSFSARFYRAVRVIP